MTLPRAGMNVAIILGMACLSPISPQAARGQVKLEYKFPENSKLTYKTTSRIRQVLTLMNNMEKASVMRETRLWTRSVGKHRNDSTVPVEDKVEFLRDEYTLPDGMKLTLDSSDSKLKANAPALKFMADIFKLESALAYTIVLDPQAKVKAVEGMEPLKAKATEIDSTIAREEFLNEIGADRLRTKFEQMIHSFPVVVARLGEPWERTEILEINGKIFTVHKKYEYRGTEKKGEKTIEKISSKILDIKYDQDPKGDLPVRVVKSDLKVESSEGIILFDREEGHVVSSSEKFRIKGTITYSAGGVDQSSGFDLSLDSNTQLQPPKR